VFHLTRHCPCIVAEKLRTQAGSEVRLVGWSSRGGEGEKVGRGRKEGKGGKGERAGFSIGSYRSLLGIATALC